MSKNPPPTRKNHAGRLFENLSGKLRAAATILDCEASRAEKVAEGIQGLREAAKDLRISADTAYRAAMRAQRARGKRGA